MKQSLGAKTWAVPTPVWCIGSYDAQEKANVMTVAWGGICCSKPPCVTISLRKATYTYDNLIQRKAYTVNIPSQQHAKEADYFGMASGRNKDKFAISGLTAVRSEVVAAPYVAEFPVVLACRVIHHYEIGLHTHFVGEILDVKADAAVLEDGRVNIEAVQPLVYNPGRERYYGIGDCIGRAFDMGKGLERK